MSPAFQHTIGVAVMAPVLVCTACAREMGSKFDRSVADALTPGAE